MIGYASWLLFAAALGAVPAPGDYFKITVVDEQTGRGVPLVELQTSNNIRYYTDSNGVVAFYEPGLMDQTVFFSVKGHGYEFPADGFGIRGRQLKVAPGGSATLKVKRINIAERLYRMTGGGIYRDSVLTGAPVPTTQPVLNAKVFGQDSVMNVIYGGKLYWFWGDTNWPAYPLGNFNMSGATSLLPGQGGLDPNAGVDLRYFVGENGFARGVAPVPGAGPTWASGVVVLKGGGGRERMLAAYSKIKDASMETYERGLLEWDDTSEQFKKTAEWELKSPVHPGGHAVLLTTGGMEYVYYFTPFPFTRVRADAELMKDLGNFETYTCLKQGARLPDGALDRDAAGQLRYSWKRNTPAVWPKDQTDLVKAGRMKPEEGLLQLRDALTGEAVLAHAGSVYWNEYRRRWVLIDGQIFGSSSMLGEIWFAEADTPLGPWVYARKIVTHEKYSFYNPKQHPYFDQEGGRIIFFEGTYTALFSRDCDLTPRYDYNQIMYKLDLGDERLALPVAVYEPAEGEGAASFRVGAGPGTGRRAAGQRIAFFAPDRPAAGAVPVVPIGDGRLKLSPPSEGATQPLDSKQPFVFFALPADTKDPPKATVPLYEFHNSQGKVKYSTEAAIAGWTRGERPLCRVWPNPGQAVPPGWEQ